MTVTGEGPDAVHQCEDCKYQTVGLIVLSVVVVLLVLVIIILAVVIYRQRRDKRSPTTDGL